MSLANLFVETIASGLMGTSLTSCSRWSEQRRIMGSPFPGPYSTKYHPWCRGVLDTKAPFNVTLKSAQAGFTEVAINRAFYTLDVKKRDVLYVVPTSKLAADFSRARFGGALASSPYIKSMFTDINSVGLKQCGANNLYIRGSRGDSNLKSVPASVLLLDEYDEFDQQAVELALERLSGQVHKEVFFVSTPTIPQYGVHKEYQTSTQEHFFFKCPLCSKHTELVWPDCVEVVGEHVGDLRIKESYIKCKECQGRLHQEDKVNFLSTGVWEPTNHNADPDRRGFAINQLYSSTVNASEIVTAYLKGQGDEFANAEFHKSKLGLPFIGTGAQVTLEQIEAVVKGHSLRDHRPRDSSRIFTMGVDQGKVGYYWVNEWFIEGRNKDINNHAFARLVDFGTFDQFNSGFKRLEELMVEWQIRACVIDADPEVGEARKFAKKFRKYVWLCRYRKGVTGNETSLSDEDTGAPIITVDRANWLAMSQSRFKTGRIELPREANQMLKNHIQAPVQTWQKDDHGNPFVTYVSIGADHFAHAACYAEIALPLASLGNTSGSIKGL